MLPTRGDWLLALVRYIGKVSTTWTWIANRQCVLQSTSNPQKRLNRTEDTDGRLNFFHNGAGGYHCVAREATILREFNKCLTNT